LALDQGTPSDSRPNRFNLAKIFPATHSIEDWVGQRVGLNALKEEENLLLLPEIKTGLLICRTCILAATATTLFLLIRQMQLA